MQLLLVYLGASGFFSFIAPWGLFTVMSDTEWLKDSMLFRTSIFFFQRISATEVYHIGYVPSYRLYRVYDIAYMVCGLTSY